MSEVMKVDQLLLILAQSGNEQERWEAAQQLGLLGDKRAVEPLIAALNDPSSPVRFTSADALGELGSGRATQALLDVLHRPDEGEDIIQAAGLALAGLDEEALEELIEVLHDKKETELVRFYTASAIGAVVGSRLRKAQSGAGVARAEQALKVVSDLSQQQALAALLKASEQAFNWKSASVKAGILQGFGSLGITSPAVIKKISLVLLDHLEDMVVRCEAAWALGHLGGPAARSVLLAAQTLVESEGEEEKDNDNEQQQQDEARKLLEINISAALSLV